MTFDDILAQIIDLLKRQGRVSYGALKRRFDLDDDYLNDLKDELLYVHPVKDDEGRGLVWTGDQASAAATPPVPETPVLPSAPATDQAREPLSYTPKHLAEKILTSRSALEGERKQVTVLFCDLANSTPIAERIGPELDFIHFGYEALSINTLGSDPVPEVFECRVKYPTFKNVSH